MAGEGSAAMLRPAGWEPARKWHDSAGSRAAASWHKQEIEDL